MVDEDVSASIHTSAAMQYLSKSSVKGKGKTAVPKGESKFDLEFADYIRYVAATYPTPAEGVDSSSRI